MYEKNKNKKQNDLQINDFIYSCFTNTEIFPGKEGRFTQTDEF